MIAKQETLTFSHDWDENEIKYFTNTFPQYFKSPSIFVFSELSPSSADQ